MSCTHVDVELSPSDPLHLCCCGTTLALWSDAESPRRAPRPGAPDDRGAAVSAGGEVVAEADGQLVGVGRRGRSGVDHVVYKLYVHPEHRSGGLGAPLLDALIGQLPGEAERLSVEHFAGNERAGAFDERHGFRVARIEPSATEDPPLAVVWRVRQLGPT